MRLIPLTFFILLASEVSSFVPIYHNRRFEAGSSSSLKPDHSLYKKTSLEYSQTSAGQSSHQHHHNDGEDCNDDDSSTDLNDYDSNSKNEIIRNENDDEEEIFGFKPRKEKALVRVKKNKPYSGPWPYEFGGFVEKELLPNPTQGKSWIVNFIFDLLKISWRIKETLFGFLDP